MNNQTNNQTNKQLIGVLLLAILLFQIPVFAQQTTLNLGNNSTSNLPANAIVGSTAERQQAWDNLTETERTSVLQRLKGIIETAKTTPPPTTQPVTTSDISFINNFGIKQNVSSYFGGGGNDFATKFQMNLNTVASPDPAGSDCETKDCDGDTLSNAFEETLADGFMPFYHISANEKVGTGFATFFDNPTSQIVNQVFGPTPPISNYRVTPLRFEIGNDGIQYGLIQLDYLTLLNKDDGLNAGTLCYAYSAVLGLALDGVQSHPLDNERAAILVAAPVPAPNTFNKSPYAYKAYGIFTAAHEEVALFDQSQLIYPNTALNFGDHIELGLSQYKHATYTFNPDYKKIFQDWVLFVTYNEIYNLYYSGLLSYEEWQAYLYIMDTLFYACVIEHFHEQGGLYPETRTNVGELNHPINGSGYINSAELNHKLRRQF